MGNLAIFKNYSLDKDPFCNSGYKNLWKIYKGSRKDRKQDVCVWVCEKKSLDKYSYQEKEEILTILRKEAGSLAKFKHPQILALVDPIEEDKSTIAFVTEQFSFALTNWVETNNISKLEVKLMVIEICQVLMFLHEDAKVIHSYLALENIFLTSQYHIKLSGFQFAIVDPPTSMTGVSGAEINFSKYGIATLPTLNFTSPEIINSNMAYYQSDIFSLGTIIYYLLKSNKGDHDRDLISLNTNSIDCYKRSVDLLENKVNKLGFESDDNNIITILTQKSFEQRPGIRDCQQHQWFNDPKLKAMKFVDNFLLNEQSKNIEFLTKFHNIMKIFETKLIEKKFLPAFVNALKTEALIVAALPAIFAIGEETSFKIDFENSIWIGLKELFTMKQVPAAGLYFILSKIKFLSEKITNTEFNTNLLSIICKALDSNVVKLQTVVLDNISFIVKKIDSLSFKNQLFPRLVNIVLKSTSTPLKVQILKSFSTVFHLLDQTILNDTLLSTLEKIRKSDNSGEISMGIVTVYEQIAKVVNIENIANKILPNLISILVSGSITKENFESIMNIVQKYLGLIKDSRKKV